MDKKILLSPESAKAALQIMQELVESDEEDESSAVRLMALGGDGNGEPHAVVPAALEQPRLDAAATASPRPSGSRKRGRAADPMNASSSVALMGSNGVAERESRHLFREPLDGPAIKRFASLPCTSCRLPIAEASAQAAADGALATDLLVSNLESAGSVVCEECSAPAHRECAAQDRACKKCLAPFLAVSLGDADDGPMPVASKVRFAANGRIRVSHAPHVTAALQTLGRAARLSADQSKCVSCRLRVAPDSSQPCDQCTDAIRRGDYCRMCCRAYGSDDVAPMVNCELCEQWVHIECDGVSPLAYLAMGKSGELYCCPNCRATRRNWASQLAKRAGVQLAGEPSVQPLLPAKDPPNLRPVYVSEIKLPSTGTASLSVLSSAIEGASLSQAGSAAPPSVNGATAASLVEGEREQSASDAQDDASETQSPRRPVNVHSVWDLDCIPGDGTVLASDEQRVESGQTTSSRRTQQLRPQSHSCAMPRNYVTKATALMIDNGPGTSLGYVSSEDEEGELPVSSVSRVCDDNRALLSEHRASVPGPPNPAQDTAAASPQGSRSAYDLPLAVMSMSSADARALLRTALCSDCGTGGGHGLMLVCADCGESRHSFCASVNTPVPMMTPEWRAQWRCPQCKSCTQCADLAHESLLLVCDVCDTSRHTFCCDPPLTQVPSGSWVCNACRDLVHPVILPGCSDDVLTQRMVLATSLPGCCALAEAVFNAVDHSGAADRSPLTHLHQSDAHSAGAATNKGSPGNGIWTGFSSNGEMGRFFCGARRSPAKRASDAQVAPPPPASAVGASHSQGYDKPSDPRRCTLCREIGDLPVQGRLLPVLPPGNWCTDDLLSGGRGDDEPGDAVDPLDLLAVGALPGGPSPGSGGADETNSGSSEWRRLRRLLASQRTSADGGRSLAMAVTWIHARCALWCPDVHELPSGELLGVRVAVARARRLKCSWCMLPGAAIGCFHAACKRSYHFACALAAGCSFTWRRGQSGRRKKTPVVVSEDDGDESLSAGQWPHPSLGTRSLFCTQHGAKDGAGAVPSLQAPVASTQSLDGAVREQPPVTELFSYQEQRGPLVLCQMRRARINGRLVDGLGLPSQETRLFLVTGPLFSTARYMYIAPVDPDSQETPAGKSINTRLDPSPAQKPPGAALGAAAPADDLPAVEQRPANVRLAAMLISRVMTVRGVRDVDRPNQIDVYDDDDAVAPVDHLGLPCGPSRLKAASATASSTGATNGAAAVSSTSDAGQMSQSPASSSFSPVVGSTDNRTRDSGPRDATGPSSSQSGDGNASQPGTAGSAAAPVEDDFDERPRRRRRAPASFDPSLSLKKSGSRKGRKSSRSTDAGATGSMGVGGKPSGSGHNGLSDKLAKSVPDSDGSRISDAVASFGDHQLNTVAIRDWLMSERTGGLTHHYAIRLGPLTLVSLGQLKCAPDLPDHSVRTAAAAGLESTTTKQNTGPVADGAVAPGPVAGSSVEAPFGGGLLPAHSPLCVYPAGFRAYRLFWSSLRPLERSLYLFTVTPGTHAGSDEATGSGSGVFCCDVDIESSHGNGRQMPVHFVVQELSWSAFDGSQERCDVWSGIPVARQYCGSSLDAVWSMVIDRVNSLRDANRPVDAEAQSVDARSQVMVNRLLVDGSAPVPPLTSITVRLPAADRFRDLAKAKARVDPASLDPALPDESIAVQILRIANVYLAILRNRRGVGASGHRQQQQQQQQQQLDQPTLLYGLRPSDYFGLTAPGVSPNLEYLPHAWRLAIDPASRYQFLHRSVRAMSRWLYFPSELWRSFLRLAATVSSVLTPVGTVADVGSSSGPSIAQQNADGAVSRWHQRLNQARGRDPAGGADAGSAQDCIRTLPKETVRDLVQQHHAQRAASLSSSLACAGRGMHSRLARRADRLSGLVDGPRSKGVAGRRGADSRAGSDSAATNEASGDGPGGLQAVAAAAAAAAAFRRKYGGQGGQRRHLSSSQGPQLAAHFGAEPASSELPTGAVVSSNTLVQVPMGGKMLSLVAAYREMQLLLKARPPRVRVQPSKIHGLGAVLGQPVERNEIIIEYAGELIRQAVADIREAQYEARGIGCYMFKIDEQQIVDATMIGNAARFINHSCEPNCYTRIVEIRSNKLILLFAKHAMPAGTELGYDYSFEGGEKLPCHCGSAICRGFMN